MKSVKTIVCAATLAVAASACVLEADDEQSPELGIAESGLRCRSSTVRVDLGVQAGSSATDAADFRKGGTEISARLCVPGGKPPKTVVLMMSGITYTKRYWDLPDPTDGTTRYSFAAAADAAGYATLAYDHLGTGQSTRPPSDQVTFANHVSIMHQLVGALRDGDIRGPNGPTAFDKVVVGGHSLGAMVAFSEATQFQDVDGVIVTGVTHKLLPTVPEFFLSNFQEARTDPKFADLDLDPGYLTTIPDSRFEMFYAPSNDVDPAVVAEDEVNKDTLTGIEFQGALMALAAQQDVRAPTFLLIGDKDALFCSQTPGDGGSDCSSAAALIAEESALYGSQTPCLDAFITPGAGHDLNAFLSSQQSFGAVIDWLNDTIGSGADTPGC